MEKRTKLVKKHDSKLMKQLSEEVTLANALSISRIPLAILSFAIAKRRPPWLLSLLHALGCFLDIADGYVARKWGAGNSPHGAHIDILCDHIAEQVVMFEFAYQTRTVPKAVPWILTIRNCITDILRIFNSFKPLADNGETHPHKAFGTFDRAGRNLSGIIKITEFIIVPLIPATGNWLSGAHVCISLYRGLPVLISPVTQKIARSTISTIKERCAS